MKLSAKITASALSAAMLFSSLPSIVMADSTREVLVTNTEELHAALADAQAGDEIILREGLYQHDDWIGVWAVFYADADGTADNHIIIRSEDPEHPAVLSGVSQDEKVALRITGSYWEIRDLVICEASKGIFLEQSEHSIISGCEVYNTGSEAIHIIDDSSYNIVEDCYIHDAGTIYPQYGEGVYIGSSHKTEGYGYECHYNTVRGCKFGPNIAADHVDIKEYTIGNIVENCTFDGTGIMNQNGGNSFIEIKGNNCIIRNNTGYRNGCENVLYAFDLNVQLDGWGQNNKIYDNTVYLDTTDVFIVKEWMCSTQVFRNVAEPSDATYSSSKTLQIREFYLGGDSTDDGEFNSEDIRRMQDYLLRKEIKHISEGNSDLSNDEQLDSLDLCMQRRKLVSGETEAPVISVDYVKEEAGAWRMTDGLGDRSVTFHVSANPNTQINTGWGYWDPNYVKDDGTTGKWIQLSLGKTSLNENGETTITVDIPTDVRRVAFQIYDYMDGSTSLDKNDVELVKVITQ